MTLHDIVGLGGVALVLLAFYLLQSERISHRDIRYLMLNFTGSAAILFSLFFEFNLASFVIEASWVAISAAGIWRWAMTRRAGR
jgi:hypothetical protein